MGMFTVATILFLIMDPIGNISILLKILQKTPPARHRWIILREMIFALLTMMIFYFIGEILFKLLNLSEITVRLSSGIILFIAAVKIIFPNMGNIRDIIRKDEEPFIVPIAIPLVAGPSLLATVMLFSHLDNLSSILFPAILISWFIATITLLLSNHIYRLVKENGLLACEKVMGMILILLGIQRFLDGLKLFIQSF